MNRICPFAVSAFISPRIASRIGLILFAVVVLLASRLLRRADGGSAQEDDRSELRSKAVARWDWPTSACSGGLSSTTFLSTISPETAWADWLEACMQPATARINIQQTVKKMDWPLLLGGATPYEDLSFRRKEDAREVQSTLAIGFKKGASLPSGLNAGHQISLLIDRETLAYSDVKSFDDLPIPFRCVATDLVSGKAHVFSTGPIGLAMRSTMSLPAIFAPVRDGDNLYVDGELVDNLAY